MEKEYSENNPHVKYNKNGDLFIFPEPFAKSFEICNKCKSNNCYKEHAKLNIQEGIRLIKMIKQCINKNTLEEINILIDKLIENHTILINSQD